MNQRTSPRATRKLGHRITAVSLEPSDQEWIDSIVGVLKQCGTGAASRSLVIREALRRARVELNGKDPMQILSYFHGGQPSETRRNEWNG